MLMIMLLICQVGHQLRLASIALWRQSQLGLMSSKDLPHFDLLFYLLLLN
jgi:hypothetical protein